MHCSGCHTGALAKFYAVLANGGELLDDAEHRRLLSAERVAMISREWAREEGGFFPVINPRVDKTASYQCRSSVFPFKVVSLI